MMPAAILLAAVLVAAPATAQTAPSLTDTVAEPGAATAPGSGNPQPLAAPIAAEDPPAATPAPAAEMAPEPAASEQGWLAALAARVQEKFGTQQEHMGTGMHDLSAIDMFMAADIVVKAVMIILVLLSVLTWGVWLSRLAALARGRRQLRTAYRALNAAGSLPAALSATGSSGNPLNRMVAAAILERKRSSAPGFPVEGIKVRAAAHLGRIEAAAARRMQAGSGILASVASSAPFIGLFGTVWGIMNSFIGIAGSGTTNLAVVAPGIAEALLATALGLAAAIPATLFHNQIARSIAGYRLMLADAAELATRTLSRDLDRPADAAGIDGADQRKAA